MKLRLAQEAVKVAFSTWKAKLDIVKIQ